MNTQTDPNLERSTRPSDPSQTPRLSPQATAVSAPTRVTASAPPPATRREMLASLTLVYQEAGLSESMARRAAQADLECDFGALALAA